MTDLAKTPWIDRTAKDLWSRIVAASPKPKWVPQRMDTKGSAVRVVELGCGHYGCVMPTDDPEVVCKITSDVTEATFIAAIATLRGEPPEGIVRYYGIYQLPGKHRGRDTFILWREAATSVGFPAFEFGREDQSRTNLRNNLRAFKMLAAYARDTLKGATDRRAMLAEAKTLEDRAWDIASEMQGDAYGEMYAKRFRGPLRLAVTLRLCDTQAEIMENTYGCDTIGDALRYYLKEGILLADVHTGNVGTVERTPGWVITDPGHAVGLEDRWSSVVVPVLP